MPGQWKSSSSHHFLSDAFTLFLTFNGPNLSESRAKCGGREIANALTEIRKGTISSPTWSSAIITLHRGDRLSFEVPMGDTYTVHFTVVGSSRHWDGSVYVAAGTKVLGLHC
jgi:hypothetical protein